MKTEINQRWKHRTGLITELISEAINGRFTGIVLKSDSVGYGRNFTQEWTISSQDDNMAKNCGWAHLFGQEKEE